FPASTSCPPGRRPRSSSPGNGRSPHPTRCGAARSIPKWCRVPPLLRGQTLLEILEPLVQLLQLILDVVEVRPHHHRTVPVSIPHDPHLLLDPGPEVADADLAVRALADGDRDLLLGAVARQVERERLARLLAAHGAREVASRVHARSVDGRHDVADLKAGLRR